MKMALRGVTCLTAVFMSQAPVRAGGGWGDSPVRFPETGALPAMYPPDLKTESFPCEPECSLFTSPGRSSGQVARIQAEMPRGRFAPPPNDWRGLGRTRRILTEGGELHVFALGDSIVNDMMRSGWLHGLAAAWPKARVRGTVLVRGSTGCWYYREENRIARHVAPRRPDLVLIGGISQRGDVESVREVIRQIRAVCPEAEVLLLTGAFGSTDPRDEEALARAPYSGTGAWGATLRRLADEERCAFLDLTAPWAEYLRSSGLHPHRFYRDRVHANEYGEQILGRILVAFFAPDDAVFAPRLEWFQDLKLGFMLHWGPYSQWGCIESWPLVPADTWARPDDLPAWVERGRDLERFSRDYRALPTTFHPARFDPDRWADEARAAGMRYVVFTTKHHDGFCMFDTRTTTNRITAPHVPFHAHPRSNVVFEVFRAFRDRGFGIGAYFSKSDWSHPAYWDPDRPIRDRNPNYDTLAEPDRWARFVAFTHAQVEELVTGYGPVDILWLDGGQVRPPRQDIRMDDLVAMARRHQPQLIVSDRTVGGRHEQYRTPEQEIPDGPQPYVWETCLTLGTQWSFKPNDRYKDVRELVHTLVDVVAKGGNLLLNVGPQPDGELPAEAVERMRGLGRWLATHGGAIYGTRPLAPFREGPFAFTTRGGRIHAIRLLEENEPPLPAELRLRTRYRPVEGSTVRMAGVAEPLPWRAESEDTLTIELPEPVRTAPPDPMAVVIYWHEPGSKGEKL